MNEMCLVDIDIDVKINVTVTKYVADMDKRLHNMYIFKINICIQDVSESF